jgi:hypothetical protein
MPPRPRATVAGLRMRRDWRPFVAIILTAGVMAVLIILAIGEITQTGPHEHLSDTESTLLSTVLGAAVGAIATYLGTHQSDKADDSDKSED